MHFFISFSLVRLNWLYDIIIYLVQLTQIFATAGHNMNMFSKIAIFLRNQFIKNLICDLISQLIFKLFILENLNFKTRSVTFYFFRK